MKNEIKKEELQIEIRKLGINGEGLGYINRKCYFVNNALPEEKCNIVIDQDNEKYATAHIKEITKESPYRVKPKCPLYDKCGACTLQHLDYEKSLEYKRDLLVQAFSKYTTLNPKSFEIKKTLPSDEQYEYRNKASMPVFFDGKKLRGGLYEQKTNKIVLLDEVQFMIQELIQLLKEY